MNQSDFPPPPPKPEPEPIFVIGGDDPPVWLIAFVLIAGVAVILGIGAASAALLGAF